MPASRPKSSKLCRVKAGIRDARSKGKAHGRPQTAAKKKEEARKLYKSGKGLSKSEIAR